MENIVKGTSKTIGFVLEIISGKWVLSGLAIQHIPYMFFKIFESYLLLDMALIQICVVVSPDSAATIQQFLTSAPGDKQLGTFFTQLITKKELDIEAFKALSGAFDL